jgi:glycosyltransferase involved in cell wall biosynthesis
MAIAPDRSCPDSMKVLSVVWFQVLPARFGGQKGTALFTDYLAREMPLTCLCAESNIDEGGLSYRIIPRLPVTKWQFIDPRCWRLIRKTARSENATVLLLEFPYHALAATFVKKRLGIPFILHAHNIESERFRQMGKWWWRLLRSYEQWACRQAALVLFKTEEEQQTAIDNFGLERSRTALVPYGIEKIQLPAADDILARFAPGGETLILFAATLDYPPNADAVTAIFNTLAPHLDTLGVSYRIIVCGRNRLPEFAHLNELSHPRVSLVGEVDHLDPYYAAASVFIDPVLSGGGVQTKIIDALARDCTVVGFERATRGIRTELAPGKVAIVPDGDWSAFAQAIARVGSERTITPEPFYKTYSWPAIIHNIAPLINAVMK